MEITNKNSGDYVKGNITNELHKQAKKKFTWHHTNVKGLNDIWQIDLLELQKYSCIKRGNHYILTVIDVLSKYCRAEPLRNKTVECYEKGFSKRYLQLPNNVQSDDGKEFSTSHSPCWWNTMVQTVVLLVHKRHQQWNALITLWKHGCTKFLEFRVHISGLQMDFYPYWWKDIIHVFIGKYLWDLIKLDECTKRTGKKVKHDS